MIVLLPLKSGSVAISVWLADGSGYASPRASLPPSRRRHEQSVITRLQHGSKQETQASPDSLHSGAAERVGTSILQDALPRHLHAGGDGAGHRTD